MHAIMCVCVPMPLWEGAPIKFAESVSEVEHLDEPEAESAVGRQDADALTWRMDAVVREWEAFLGLVESTTEPPMRKFLRQQTETGRNWGKEKHPCRGFGHVKQPAGLVFLCKVLSVARKGAE